MKTRVCVEADGKARVQRKSLKMQDRKGIMNEWGSRWRQERAWNQSRPDTEEEQLLREQRKGKEMCVQEQRNFRV